jgi:formamidopyrimidine-DNA glycosylase
MPELPEVETIARQLAPAVVGRRVVGVSVLDPRLREGAGPTPGVRGRAVAGVRRAGKRVLIELGPRTRGGDPLWLAVHLRMTGRLLWREASGDRRPERARARLALDGGSVWFTDTRRLGTIEWIRRSEDVEPEGIDPMTAAFTAARLRALVEGSREPLKTWLLRQDRLAGLGNIYASEILHRARLSPLRTGTSLEPSDVRRLHRATRRVLERAIRASGTTFSDYRDSRGEGGSYQNRLAVYDRAGRTCRRCRGTIERIVQGQRSTYWCPGCQA